MAKSVLELAVGTGSWDAGLKRATKSLNDFISSQGGLKQALDQDSEKVKTFVQMMGKMESTSKTLRGQMNDYKSTIEQLTVQYNQLSEAQKKTIGQDYLKSIEQLKSKYADAKEQLSSVSAELGETKQSSLNASEGLNALNSVLGVNIKSLVGWGAAIAGAKAAMSIMKSTMEATEATADSYATIQAQLNGVVDSFFRSLNEGSFTNFLSGLSDVAKRAREAYEAMDELGSFAVRYNPKNQVDMQQINKLLKEARALKAKGDKEGAAAKTAEANSIAEQAKKNTLAYGEKEYQAGVKSLQSLLGGTGVKFTEGQLKYYSDPANWDKVQKAAQEYGAVLTELRQSEQALAAIGQSGNQKMIKAYNERYQAAQKAMAAQSESNRRAYTYLNTRDSGEKGAAFAQATSQIYGRERAQFAVDAIQAQIDRADAVVTSSGRGGSNKTTTTPAPEGSIAAQEQLVSDLTKKWKEASDQVGRDGYLAELEKAKKTLAEMQTSVPDVDKLYPVQEEPSGPSLTYLEQAKQSIATSLSDKAGTIDSTAFTSFLTVAVQRGIDGLDPDFTVLQQKIAEGLDIPDSDWEALQEKINEKLAEMDIDPIKINLDTGTLAGNKELAKDAKNTAQAWQSATAAINSAGSALQSLEDPGAKVAGIVAQAVANIALGFAQATASKATGAAGVFGWIAAATAGLATMVATIATIKSTTKGGFATGGIVPGNYNSGDQLRTSDYGINSGELVLTKAQQNNLANALTGNPMSGLNLETVISGEQIRVVLTRNSLRRGGGEYLTSKSRY